MQHHTAANACLLTDDSPTSYILRIFCKSYRTSGCVFSDTYHMTHIKVILAKTSTEIAPGSSDTAGGALNPAQCSEEEALPGTGSGL